jgi:trypsin
MRSIRRALLPAALLTATLAGFTIGDADAVVGGADVPQGKYPFMAAVLDGGGQICGGSVVASTWVLTAAHCVPDDANGADAAGEYSVSVGDVDYTEGTEIDVVAIFQHPEYDATGSSENDVALLQLASSVPSGVTAIDLADAPADDGLEATGTPVVVAGWGSEVPIVGLVPPVTTTMKETDLEVVGDDDCSEDLDAATQVCAEAFLADSCQGDSGGPLFAVTGAGTIQIGVVSYGFGCATPSFPGVYAEVNAASIRSFITQHAGV